jgi:hypothetical protein
MRFPRRKWLYRGLLLAIVLRVALWLVVGGSGHVTFANFQKIREGMTKADVDALLGQKNGREDLHGLFPGASATELLYVVDYCEDDGSSIVPGDQISITFSNSAPEHEEWRVAMRVYSYHTLQQKLRMSIVRIRERLGW